MPWAIRVKIKNTEADSLKEVTRKWDYIAVDFDGTVCEHRFPEIGEPKMEIIEFLRRQHELGTKIILHTCRENMEQGKWAGYLTKAYEWCLRMGVPVDAVNHNPWVPYGGRKIYADIYIDDRAVNVVML